MVLNEVPFRSPAVMRDAWPGWKAVGMHCALPGVALLVMTDLDGCGIFSWHTAKKCLEEEEWLFLIH